MSLNVKGALRNKFFVGFTDDKGRELTSKQAEAYLRICEFEGKRVIPISASNCEGFNFQTGCPGHEMKPAQLPNIDKDKPFPKVRSKRWPLPDMRVGDSFWVPREQRLVVANAACYFAKKVDAVFSVRQDDGGYRVWRIK